MNDTEYQDLKRAYDQQKTQIDLIRSLIDPTKATPGSTAHKILAIIDTPHDQN